MQKRLPVFLGHSVVGSSAIWTFAPNHSLAYMLADEGKYFIIDFHGGLFLLQFSLTKNAGLQLSIV